MTQQSKIDELRSGGWKAQVAGLARRPLSGLSGILAALLIAVPLYQRIAGSVYFEPLNYVDSTTLIMVGVLLLRGLVRRRADTDLQAVSVALVGALSFVFAYEAIYKLSFYTFPWRMSREELREFVIQIGITLTALTGFAFGKFTLSPLSRIFLVAFVAGWTVWLLIGFPQLDTGASFYPPVVAVPLTKDLIYLVNRATKVALFLAYYFFYSDQPTRDVRR